MFLCRPILVASSLSNNDNDILQICKKDYAVDFFLERKSHPYDKLPERRERQTDEDNRECNDDDDEEEEEEECL